MRKILQILQIQKAVLCPKGFASLIGIVVIVVNVVMTTGKFGSNFGNGKRYFSPRLPTNYPLTIACVRLNTSAMLAKLTSGCAAANIANWRLAFSG